MSIKLSNRINRVAKELKRKHPCKVCFGKGKWAITYMHEGDQEPPMPDRCPGCGEVQQIIVNYIRVRLVADESIGREAGEHASRASSRWIYRCR